MLSREEYEMFNFTDKEESWSYTPNLGQQEQLTHIV